MITLTHTINFDINNFITILKPKTGERGGSLFKTKIAPLQTQTLIETKISHIKMVKLSLVDDCAINEKCYSVDGGPGTSCPLFSSPARGI